MTQDIGHLIREAFGVSGQASAVDVLRAFGRAREAIDRQIRLDVAQARADGWSWSQIGAALGVSRQAAQARYSAELGSARHPATREPSPSATAARRTAARHPFPLSMPFGALKHQRNQPDRMSPK